MSRGSSAAASLARLAAAMAAAAATALGMLAAAGSVELPQARMELARHAAGIPDRPEPLPPPAPPAKVLVVSPPPPPAIDLGDVRAPLPAAQDRALRARLDAAVAESGVVGTVGIVVIDPDGRVVYDLGGDQPLRPASTSKLVTAAAALIGYGPDHRFTTRLLSTAAPGPDGTVSGTLVLEGSGDPTLATPVFDEEVWPDRPATPLAALADAAVAAGVARVEGGVVGDPSWFAGPSRASGWREGYFTDLDTALTSALTIDAGRELVDVGGRLQGVVAADPALAAAQALATLLGERGVAVAAVRSSPTPPQADLVVGAVASAPLAELLAWTVQRSDNHLADGIFRAVGRLGFGDGSWTAAHEEALRALEPLGLDLASARLEDGSGLSRLDRLSARQLAELSFRMATSPLATSWAEAQAVAGESGTLRRRLLGTIAEGRLRGKTGSLDDVRALAGQVVGPDGRSHHFAVVVDRMPPDAVAAAVLLQDLVVLELTADLLGCERVTPPSASPSPDVQAPPRLPDFACPSQSNAPSTTVSPETASTTPSAR